ncbi:MAG: ribosome biogenesis GTP-binding protein YihA/YsxC [Bacilli bacterium]|jgi:GTP-binding protein
MAKINSATFIKSAPSIKEAPLPRRPEIVFVGRSNVGKSSLINALTNRKNLAYISSKPGHTTLLNYYLINEEFYLVDVPGYGYSSKGKRDLVAFGKMMEEYFENNEFIRNVCFLVDSRHFPSSDDLDFFHFVTSFNLPFTLVLTKSDKLNQKGKSAAKKNMLEAFNISENDFFFVSIKNQKQLDELRDHLFTIQ